MTRPRTIAPVLSLVVQTLGVDNEDRFEARRELRRIKAVIRAAESDPDPRHAVEISLNDWARGAAFALEWALRRKPLPSDHNLSLREFAARAALPEHDAPLDRRSPRSTRRRG